MTVGAMCHSNIEIFRTNIPDKVAAAEILHKLAKLFPRARINFDLQDCDKILRIEGPDFFVEDVINLIHLKGYACEILD